MVWTSGEFLQALLKKTLLHFSKVWWIKWVYLVGYGIYNMRPEIKQIFADYKTFCAIWDTSSDIHNPNLEIHSRQLSAEIFDQHLSMNYSFQESILNFSKI